MAGFSVHASGSVYRGWRASRKGRRGGGAKVIGERLPRNERNKLDVKRFSWYIESRYRDCSSSPGVA